MKSRVKKSTRLSTDGEKVLKLLIIKYGMTRDNAVRLMQDGKAPLAIALMAMTR